MFTAATFQLIRKNSPAEFEALLNRLGIETDWSGDEFRIYDRLDVELTEKLCVLMKSPTVIDGYMNLLDLGGVAYKYGEYDELLGKVVANKDKILRGLENLPKFVEVETPKPQPTKSSKQKTRTEIKKEHVFLWGPIGLGAVLIAVGLVFMYKLDNENIGKGLIILGIISAGVGLKGKEEEKTIIISVEAEHEPKPVKQTSVRKEAKPPFTRNELQRTLDILTQLNKIICAI